MPVTPVGSGATVNSDIYTVPVMSSFTSTEMVPFRLQNPSPAPVKVPQVDFIPHPGTGVLSLLTLFTFDNYNSPLYLFIHLFIFNTVDVPHSGRVVATKRVTHFHQQDNSKAVSLLTNIFYILPLLYC